MKTRNEYIKKLKEEYDHVIHDSDPLYSVSVEYGCLILKIVMHLSTFWANFK